jgi:IS1 family transposase
MRISRTDDGDAFPKTLPPERHLIGKAHTISIEQGKGNARHHLGRMARRTKLVSKQAETVAASIEFGVP